MECTLPIQEEKVKIRALVEACLFSSPDPISYKKLLPIIQKKHPISLNELKEMVALLKKEYIEQKRGFVLLDTPEGTVLRTHPDFHEEVGRLIHGSASKISKSSLEALALIAYKQPITRTELEAFRGVSCQNALRYLVEEGFVETVGQKQVIGNPKLYGTTKKFLTHFNLSSIKDLPHYMSNSSLFEEF